jgi:hypothetical protein
MKSKIVLTIAGFTAITINTIMLKFSSVFGIKAESGGLLKLVIIWLPKAVSNMGFVKTQVFWYIFHFATGAAMVIFYYLTFKKINMPVLWKGILFSLFPWLINALIVLPLLHQGVLGITKLSAEGIVYFFFANLAFGLSLVYTIKILEKASGKSPILF